MSKRRKIADIERIRAEIREFIRNPPPPEQLVRKRLNCGHDQEVAPNLAADKAICSQCRQTALLSRQ